MPVLNFGIRIFYIIFATEIKQTIMKDNDNITFLTVTPIGTKMYLIIQNRVMTEIWMKEAIYQGYTKHYRTETWSDVHIAPCTIKVTVYHVKFTVDNKPITIICSSPSYWYGQRGDMIQMNISNVVQISRLN